MTGKHDRLTPLRCIDSLEVGPVRVEPDRLVAPYGVHTASGFRSTELVVKYEEPVFTPGEPAGMNLAAMVCAQVALNYGLFCDRIVFHGIHDRHDRRFLDDMARNTAREIYVKKFLQPNPFLVGPAASLPVVKQDHYLRAELVFDPPGPDTAATARWEVEAAHHAVLSSGGKDSLLSFGLLDEIGCNPHAVFINESGRHWFTALNAYRHFRERIPATHRVWTNADRVFAWMLRQLPFVRADFNRLRTDDYPVRLWTVAVFVFCALPLLRRYGIERLVIGDEYDTTTRQNHRGINHYDGLYDQSRFFDNAMSRYFRRKGWGFVQFSLLRPLSELLVEKTLAERYPRLHRQQVSCHAAHQHEGKILPCGNCEKCRRIVAMLRALDLDPARCSYTPDQIERCLAQLGNKGVHQEIPAIQHLAWLLRGRLLRGDGSIGGAAPRAHPEVMKLRFDPVRSPPETVPVNLRGPLLDILLSHADGAVKKNGRVWIDFEPDAGSTLVRPYEFTSPRAAVDRPAVEANAHPDQDEAPGVSTFLLGELTWPAAAARLRQVDVALLPVGAVEQHGHHLPLDTDAFDADYLARAVARACSDPKPVVLPLIPYGVSYHHEDFAGTLSISPDTLRRLVYEVGMGAARNGITKLVIVNGHGGNTPALKFAAQLVNRDAHIFSCVETGETSDADIQAVTETPNDVHAGEVETSTSLATRPHLVHLDAVRAFVPAFSSRYLDFSSKRAVEWYARTAKLSDSGVLGDPTRATRQKGEEFWRIMIRNLVEFVEDIKGMTLDEIYQRRY